MRNKLFDVVDDQPVVNALLLNLGPFKDLWESDKSEDKSVYIKHLMYIYYVADPRSPFFDSDSEEKEKDIKREVYGRTNYRTPNKVLKCIEEYRKRNTSAETRALESAIVVCDDITYRMSKRSKDHAEFDNLIDEIDSEIKNAQGTSEKIVLMQKKLELQDKNLELAKKAADMIPRLKSQVESMIEMRDQVENAIAQIEGSNKAIENFIIDDFIAEEEITNDLDELIT